MHDFCKGYFLLLLTVDFAHCICSELINNKALTDFKMDEFVNEIAGLSQGYQSFCVDLTNCISSFSGNTRVHGNLTRSCSRGARPHSPRDLRRGQEVPRERRHQSGRLTSHDRKLRFLPANACLRSHAACAAVAPPCRRQRRRALSAVVSPVAAAFPANLHSDSDSLAVCRDQPPVPQPIKFSTSRRALARRAPTGRTVGTGGRPAARRAPASRRTIPAYRPASGPPQSESRPSAAAVSARRPDSGSAQRPQLGVQTARIDLCDEAVRSRVRSPSDATRRHESVQPMESRPGSWAEPRAVTWGLRRGEIGL